MSRSNTWDSRSRTDSWLDTGWIMPSNTETSRTSPSSATRVFPPGPKPSLLGTITYRPGRDPLKFFSDLAHRYGDLAYLRMAGEHLFIASDPNVVRDVLVTHNQNFH